MGFVERVGRDRDRDDGEGGGCDVLMFLKKKKGGDGMEWNEKVKRGGESRRVVDRRRGRR